MPLRPGKSRNALSANISELLHGWRQTGKIGTSSPRSTKAARKQAAAIAYSKSRESRR